LREAAAAAPIDQAIGTTHTLTQRDKVDVLARRAPSAHHPELRAFGNSGVERLNPGWEDSSTFGHSPIERRVNNRSTGVPRNPVEALHISMIGKAAHGALCRSFFTRP
jgi:hypothetical protein